jgi:arylsulfatase A-like enzyme
MKQKRSHFLNAAGTSTLALSALGTFAATQTQPPLNVLFIMSDQHNARALGCYGSTEVKTPNLDALAAQGAVFTRAICQTPQCIPSRYSIFTGRYARSTGTYSNGCGQNSDENTVADLFHAQGYFCGTIGKHHMDMTPENKNHGFDLVDVPHGFWEYSKSLPYEQAHPGRAKVGECALPNQKHDAGMVAQATIDFIRDHKSKPFVVWCSFEGPHTPICVSKPWSEWYDPSMLTLPPTWNQQDMQLPGMDRFLRKSGTYDTELLHRQTLAYYYGYVSQIDHNIGLVLQELEKSGLAGNTIVVYTADHGEMMAEHGLWTKCATGYEPTIRVPMIIRLPGIVPAGTRVNELACSIDLLPTLMEAAGLNIPVNVQGKSLLPLAQGKAVEWRKYAVSELGSSVDSQVVAITSTTRKYVRFKKGGKLEYEQLFDLVKDPWETQNVLSDKAYAGVQEEFKKALADWEATTPAAKPIPLGKKKGRAGEAAE